MLLHVLPPTSNIVTQQNLLLQVEKSRRQFDATCCFNLQQHYVAMFEVGGNMCNNVFNLQRNNVVLQVEEKCCPYYRALTNLFSSTRQNLALNLTMWPNCTYCNAKYSTSFIALIFRPWSFENKEEILFTKRG